MGEFEGIEEISYHIRGKNFIYTVIFFVGVQDSKGREGMGVTGGQGAPVIGQRSVEGVA